MKGQSKILVDNIHWYSELVPGSYLEKDFEETVLMRGSLIFKDFYFFEFNHFKITSNSGETATADLCLIRKDYSEWFVVEVERYHKPFSKQTRKQFRVFSDGIYDPDYILSKMLDKKNDLDKVRALDMLNNDLPGVLIIVDEFPSWRRKALNFDRTQLMVISMFENENNDEIYRIDGDYPYLEIGRSRCKINAGYPRLIEIQSHKILPIPSGEIMTILVRGKMTRWERFDDVGKVYLMPKGIENPLNPKSNYFLLKTKEEDYIFHPSI